MDSTAFVWYMNPASESNQPAFRQISAHLLVAGKAAAAAANTAFDANLDLVVALGWAHMEARSHQIFQDEVAKAPQQLQAPLRSLALLYGMTRVERNAAFYLAHNALGRPHFQVDIPPPSSVVIA